MYFRERRISFPDGKDQPAEIVQILIIIKVMKGVLRVLSRGEAVRDVGLQRGQWMVPDVHVTGKQPHPGIQPEANIGMDRELVPCKVPLMLGVKGLDETQLMLL